MRGFPRRASGQRIDPIWPSSFSEDLRALLRQEKSPSYPYHAFFGATQGTVASWHKAVPGSTDYPPARPARRCKAYGKPLRPRNGRRGLVKDWRYILLDAIQHEQSLKFSHKILLAASLVVFAAFALFTLYNDYLQRNAIREDLESYLREMGDVTSSNIQNWLGGRLLLVEQTAQTLARDHSPETVSALLEQPALTSTFSFTYLGQQDGVFTMRPDSPMPAGYDPRSRPWYKDAVAAGGLTLTEPYVDAATQELIITAATPVKAAGNTLGVVGGDLSLKTLVQIINSLDFSGMGYAFLVSGDGKILVHPDKEQVMKTLSEVYPQNTPKIATGFSEAELHGHTRILAFTPIKGLPSVTWYLALSIDKDKAYAMLSKFRVSAIAAALISIVAILVLLGLLIRLLMQPLHLMGRAMQDIAQGEGDLTKRLAVTSRDEFGARRCLQPVRRAYPSLDPGSRRDRAQTARRLATGGERLELFDGQPDEQSNRTNSVAAAINELGAAAQEIARNAADASHHASDANHQAEDGKQVVEQTIRAMNELSEKISASCANIEALNSRTVNIGQILEVIRASPSRPTCSPSTPPSKPRARRGRTRLRSGRRRGAQPGPSRPGVGPADPEDDRRAASRRPRGGGHHDREPALQPGERGDRQPCRRKPEQRDPADRRDRRMNQSVATATEEQTAVVDSLNMDITEINTLNQEGVENLQATLRACGELETQAGRLRQLVDSFKI